MPWIALFKYLGPILSVLLAGLTSHSFDGIQSGAYGAEPTNYALTGLTGLGSLLSLVTGIVASWKSTGKIPVTTIAEVVALQTLGAALAADGDTDGLALLSPLSKHIVERKTLKEPPR